MLRLPRRRNDPYREFLQILGRVAGRAGSRCRLAACRRLDRQAQIFLDSGLQAGRVTRPPFAFRSPALSLAPRTKSQGREFMKIVGFEANNNLHLGVVEGDTVVNLQAVDAS